MVNKWRQTMVEGMQRELSFHPEINFLFKDANGNTQQQIKQIAELINQKIDLLIVSPNEAAPITPIVEKAYHAGIKVIIVDRRTLSDNYTAYVGASNYEVGESAGAYTHSLLKGRGNILEVSDIPGSSADIDRHSGFLDFIKKYEALHYISKIYEQGDEHPSDANTTAFLKSHPDIQLIFAQNDRLALSAYNACKNLGLENKIKIIGVDGLSGNNGGIDLVEKGIIKATIFYPTGGQESIQTAIDILEGKPYQKQKRLITTVIDSTNVRIMKLQNDKITAQQNDIDRRQKIIERQKIITQNQNTIIYAISISLALALIFGFILLYYLRENKKINATLALQNEEILNQRNQLIELGKQAQEASNAKINFFTKISHEFRTPLTLILSPLEEMKSNPKLDNVSRQYVGLIQKNSMRLVKLINELIDFRKIESAKMKLQASENDVVQFISEIIEAFKAMARKRNIDLRLITKERSIAVYFDASMMDKVIFNLLANAFKFTHDNGFIYVTIEKNEADKTVIISVEDNGIGMSQDIAAHAFELFYQGNISYKPGSGLGLSLSREFIQLHHGNISVASKQGIGTTFTIVLPLGASHLKEEEIVDEITPDKKMDYDERIFLTQPAEAEISAETHTDNKSDNTVLIIEDDADLRNYLVLKLSNNYHILEADDGITAIQQAFDNVPDLIVSDIMLPGKDGFAITNILKSDIRTSHIPIILLTARTAMQQQIEGMRSKADAYIVKPFNMQFLEETIKSVLRNREMLREHYTSQLPVELKSHVTISKLDKKFLNDFTSIVESNISNDEFNIDEICKKIGVSRIQLYRKVKALLGCNVNDYILNVRLQKAKYFLNETELSIAEIADKVGFSSAAYFSTVFKNKFIVTPSEFREKGNVAK
jgi:signal transduction histidine kinase/DNA-binding response OmpR family regulator